MLTGCINTSEHPKTAFPLLFCCAREIPFRTVSTLGYHPQYNFTFDNYNLEHKCPKKRVRINVNMPPNIIPFTVLTWTPTKRKFKPLFGANFTCKPAGVCDDQSGSGRIHAEDDFKWLPLCPSSLKKPPITLIWLKTPFLSSSKEELTADYKITMSDQEEYIHLHHHKLTFSMVNSTLPDCPTFIRASQLNYSTLHDDFSSENPPPDIYSFTQAKSEALLKPWDSWQDWDETDNYEEPSETEIMRAVKVGYISPISYNEKIDLSSDDGSITYFPHFLC